MTPLTRKENYLNEIVGWGETAPEKPLTPEEFFFAAILGEAVQTPEPLTRYQMYLAKIAGRDIEIPTPITRLEYFLAKAAGMDITVPVPITREEIYWSNYIAIVEFEVEGVPPLTYKAIEGTLENYRIYGNTVNGESVGDKTGNLFDMSSAYAIGYIDDSGNIAIAQGYMITTYDFIPIDQNSSYSIKICGKLNDNTNQRKIRVAFYDRDQIFISRTGLGEASVVRTFNAINNSHYIRLSIDDGNTNIMLNEGSTPLPYEPYGYRVPVSVTNGTDTEITNLYLLEQIKMVGSEAEYIDYAEQKMHRIGEDDIDVTLPALPTLPGTNVLSVGTAVQPSKVYVKYKGERQ